MLKTHFYWPFGIQLASDLAMPELPSLEETFEPSALIRAGSHQEWPVIEASTHSTSSLQLAPGEWRLNLEGIGRFRASGGELLEWERWDDNVSDRDLRTFLVTSGLGALAMQRGQIILHGTALERDGHAVLILGHPATGKSTLAFLLIQQGWSLLSSELVNIDKNDYAWPGQQQLKIWHDAVFMMNLDWMQLRPVRRGLKRQAVLPPYLRCSNKPVPIKHAYILRRLPSQGIGGNNDTTEEVKISTLIPVNLKLRQLNDHMFQARTIRGMNKEFETFMKAVSLASRLTIHYLYVPDTIQAMKRALKCVDLLAPLSTDECS